MKMGWMNKLDECEMDDGGDRRGFRRIDQVDGLGCERQDALSVCWNPGTCTETAGRTPEGDPVGKHDR